MPDPIAEAFRSAMRLDHAFVLRDNMTFDDVPGWDSIGHMNLVTELERRFAITLNMDDILTMDNVRAVRDLISRKRPA